MEENNIPQEGSSIDFMKIFKDLLKYKKGGGCHLHLEPT